MPISVLIWPEPDRFLESLLYQSEITQRLSFPCFLPAIDCVTYYNRCRNTPPENPRTHGSTPEMLTAWFGIIAYAVQIYFDFSAYGDMAIGLARLFGIRLLIDFWRRWHIILSRFLAILMVNMRTLFLRFSNKLEQNGILTVIIGFGIALLSPNIYQLTASVKPALHANSFLIRHGF